MSIRSITFVVLLQSLSLLGCGEPRSDIHNAENAIQKSAAAPVRKFDFKPREPVNSKLQVVASAIEFPEFTDVARELGVAHVFDNGASPKALMVESTGGGCGWFDYDRDGCLDLYLSQGGIPCPSADDAGIVDAFFRQTPQGTFLDCAASIGIQDLGFGHGVAAGDFDNDGFDDLFVANAGQSHLYLNLGDGTFQDGTARLTGLRNVWSSNAAWGDVDRDGDLDLYVCNYAIYDPCHPIECLDKDGIPSICHPRNVEPEPDEFFLNTGAGELVECARDYGLFGPGNKALGVVIADLTGDQWPDIFIANDTTANFFFVNDGRGHSFKESAMILGGAFSATGEPQASMGVAVGDYDNNAFPDLYLTHFTGESNTLYRNLGAQGLQDVSSLVGLREPSLPKLGFGTVMSDFNLDGWMDLFVTNGHIDPRYSETEGYEMVPQLFSFDGSVWKERNPVAGDFFSRRVVGRGVASGDFDADGDLDLCVVHHNSPAALLRNDSDCGRVVRVGLTGRMSNRNGYNAKVTVKSEGGQRVQELPGGTSYAASHDRVLFFGLGAFKGPVRVEVEWPSGVNDVVEGVTDDDVVAVLEGAGPQGK